VRPARVVDYQAHWYPATYLETITGRDTGPTARRDGGGVYTYVDDLGQSSLCPHTFHDLDVHLADMDEHGVDVAVISPNLLGEVSRLPVADAVGALEAINAEVGRAQRQHPDRLVGLAMLPMQDPDAAIQVLDRACRDDDLAGVCLLSNIAGRPIVEDGLLSVYRRIEELEIPIFLHPAHTSVVHAVGFGPTIDIGLAWMFETAAAALSLIYAGVLDECPGLVVVHPHLGGALPAVVDRVVDCQIGTRQRHELRAYLKRNFYVDCVQRTPRAALLAIETYGLDRVVYGTDFPWLSRNSTREAVERTLSEPELERVFANVVPNLRLPAD